MGKINAARSEELPCRDIVHVTLPSICLVSAYHLPDTFRERLSRTLIPAQQVVEYIHSKLILVFRDKDLIPTLAQIIDRRVDSPLQERSRLPLFIGTSGTAPWFIFKDQKEPACDRLMGTDLLYKL